MGKKSNNEDVPASVAGFYYQVLLACREITQLIIDAEPEDTMVGIERGADVKIIRSNDINTSIEAKFYGASFNKYSKSIYHTICNFYKNSRDDDSLIFETNVAIEDDEDICFSKDWSGIEKNKIEKYIRYVKICLIREYVEKIKNSKDTDAKKIKEKFNRYRDDNELPKSSDFKTIEHIVDNQITIEGLSDIDIVSDSELKTFIRKFQFRFQKGDISKLLSINEIKSQISKNLKTIKDNRQITTNHDLTPLLIDKFLLTTVEYTDEDKRKYNIKDEFTTISVAEVITLLISAEDSDSQLIENSQLQSLIEAIESQEIDFYEELSRYLMKEQYLDIESIKSNYMCLRSAMMESIDKYGLQVIISYYAVKTHGGNNTITTLLKYVSIMALDQQHDVNEVNFGLCPVANIRFDDTTAYSYKYSSDDNLESYIINLMEDVIYKKQLELISDRFPILMNYTTNRSCHDDSVELYVTSDIANIQRTNDINLQFSALDYRCVGCFTLKQYINTEPSFSNCKKIKITAIEDDKKIFR